MTADTMAAFACAPGELWERVFRVEMLEQPIERDCEIV
jgi:hypothetical protein